MNMIINHLRKLKTMSNKSKKFNIDFLPIPYCVIQDKKMTRAQEYVMGLVYLMDVRRQNEMFMSNTYMGEILQMTPMTVSNSLAKLQKAGYITMTYKDKEKRNRDRIYSNIRTGLVPSADIPRSTCGTIDVPPVDGHNKINNNISNITANAGINFCKELNPEASSSWYRIKAQREAGVKIADMHEKKPELLLWLISMAKDIQGKEYAPLIDSPWAFINKFAKLKAYLKSHGIKYEVASDELEKDAEELGYSLGD